MTAAAAFRALHQGGCFVMPNPWDRGSAVLLAQLGFSALATSSAGFAFTRGLPDDVTALARDEVLAHVADLVAATPLPVSADFQDGYGADPGAVAASVGRCAATGVAGLSIEDATGDPDQPLYDPVQAVERVAAARAACPGLVLTARAECFLVGHPDPLAESIRRLRAYADAGADVLFAPGLRSLDQVRAVVDAVGPKPVNVLLTRPDWSVGALAELGVRRISVGSALARVGWTAALAAARTLADGGSVEAFAGILSTGDLSARFTRGPGPAGG